MNISWNQASGFLRRINSAGMLKSTQDRLERQEETQRQVDFLEKQKDNLRNVACGSIEEIAEKLNTLHSYEEQIAAVKAAYNREQISHILDEAEERGEKIAESIERTELKTPEERAEELAEEALGAEENEGSFDEIMDEIEKVAEELTEDIAKELEEELPENAELSAQKAAETAEAFAAAEAAKKEAAEAAEIPEGYLPFDVRL